MFRSSALLLLLSVLLTACGGGGGSDAEFIDDRVLLENIRVTPASASIAAGLTQAFTATGEYSDGSEQDLTNSVNWSSSDADVASIDATGSALGVSAGTAEIQASLDGFSGTATLTVTDPVIVETAILPPLADIPLGGTQDYRAFAIYSDGRYENVTFSAEWALQNESGIIQAYEPVLTRGLVALDDFGTVIGVAIGEDALIASVNNVSTQAGAAVISPQLSGLSISPRDESLPAGAMLRYSATATYTDGTSADLTKVVAWASSNDAIATISNEPGARGTANALSPGQVDISATFEGFTDRTTLTVIADDGDEVIRVDVLPPMATIGVSETLSYMAIAITRDGDTFDVSNSTTWSSSNASVATVSSTGLATGLSGGTTEITAEFAGVAGSATLKVEAEVILESIVVSQANPTFVSLTRAACPASAWKPELSDSRSCVASCSLWRAR